MENLVRQGASVATSSRRNIPPSLTFGDSVHATDTTGAPAHGHVG
jgi:hypothetical protein